MEIHCPWVYVADLSNSWVDLSVEEGRHVHHVLRCREGQSLVAFDGYGHFRLGKLVIEKKGCKVTFTEPKSCENQPICKFTLVQFLPNNVATFEEILKKSCELGIFEIVPILGMFTEKQHWTLDVWKKRQERFQRILVESCKQAKNPFLPKLNFPINFEQLAEEILENSVYGSLNALINAPIYFPNAKHIACIIGPEGGFSKLEEDILSKKSKGIHLPTPVMRVETAVVAVVSVMKVANI